jgi:putative peptidoglycan lipid II flippase
VPVFAHAALTLSIGMGAMVNAIWLLLGLIQRGSYKPEPGWARFVLQVIAACAVLGFFLMWANGHYDWTALRSQSLQRIWLLTLMLLASAAIYFVVLWVTGMKFRQLVRR